MSNPKPPNEPYDSDKVKSILIDGRWEKIVVGSFQEFNVRGKEYFIATQRDAHGYESNLIGDSNAIRALKSIQ